MTTYLSGLVNCVFILSPTPNPNQTNQRSKKCDQHWNIVAFCVVKKDEDEKKTLNKHTQSLTNDVANGGVGDSSNGDGAYDCYQQSNCDRVYMLVLLRVLAFLWVYVV